MRIVLKSLLTFGLALLIGALVLLLSGNDPLEVYAMLYEQAFGTRYAIADTLLITTPLIFTGVAISLAFKAGVFNIGVEGSLYLGAFAAAWVGFTFVGLPAWALIPLAFLAAGLVGLLWSVIPGYFRAYFAVDEVVTTLLLTYVAISFTGYLVNYPFLAPGAANNMSIPIASQAQLPRLMPPSQLNIALLLALITIVAAAFLLHRTTLGYRLRAVGLNPAFARATGISVPAMIVTAMALSGFVGGLAGAGQILGVHYRFVQGFSPGYGFDGIAIALLAQNNPLGVIFGALLFGALRSGGTNLQLFLDVPLDLINILQAIVILLITAEFLWKRGRWPFFRRTT
jgi:simple sugar transport system permease protein